MLLTVMDPPWDADAGGGRRGAQTHYPLAGVDGIAQVIRTAPFWRDDGDALVFMWATALALHAGDAHALANRLNVRVCAGFVWAKIDRTVDAGEIQWFKAPARMGLGQWSRCEHEHLLVCRRGDVPVPSPKMRQRSMIYAPRGVHSAKPDEAWRVIEETAHGSIDYVRGGVEIFARRRRRGWGAWGHLDGPEQPARLELAAEGELWAMS